MSKFNNIYKKLVKEDVNREEAYAILYGRVVYPIGSIMENCPFEDTGRVRIIGIDKIGSQIYEVHLGSFSNDHSTSENEGYTHTVDQSNPPGAKDETGNNLNIKIVTIRNVRHAGY